MTPAERVVEQAIYSLRATPEELRALAERCMWHAEALESTPNALIYSTKSADYRNAATALEACADRIEALELENLSLNPFEFRATCKPR